MVLGAAIDQGAVAVVIVGLLTLLGVIYTARKTQAVHRDVGRPNGAGNVVTMLEDVLGEQALARQRQEAILDEQVNAKERDRVHEARDEVRFAGLYEHANIEMPDA